MIDPTTLSITEAARQMREGTLTSVMLVQACLDRIEARNEEINALAFVSPTALEEAKAMDARRANGEELPELAGIPIAIKDNILVRGWHASAGSRVLESFVAPYDATVVARLREQGAIFIGRANMDEFAMGSSNESCHYGVVRNPWDTQRVPGGSSGGSAAAVAAGFCLAALGSDTGGSIRQPASLCGVTGLKPTYGRVSRYGLIALASSLDQIGPFAKTAADAAIVLRAIEGKDEHDATSSGPYETYLPEVDTTPSVEGLRIGLPSEYFREGMDERIKQSVMEAVKVLEDAGATIVPVSLPTSSYALAAYYLIMPAEASSNLARFDGIRYGYSAGSPTLSEIYERTRAEGFGTEVKRRIMLGTFELSKGYYDAYYRKALKARERIRRDMEEAFRSCDIIASPTSPSLAWPIGEKIHDPVTMYLSDIYTISANLAGVPGISVPCGVVDGLPVGLQFMSRSFDDAQLLRVACAYQSKTDWHTRLP